MKRVLAILLAAVLLAAVMPVSAFASSTKTVYISRNGSGTINLREGPGYDYDITGNYVHHNNKVTVQKTSGSWSKVKVSSTGKVGWIRTYYIDGTTKSLGSGSHKITKAATIYKKASSSSSKQGKVYVGDTVKVYYTERDYAQVKVNGSSSFAGWIPMSVIGGVASTKVEEPSSSSGTVYRVKTFTGQNLNLRKGPGEGYGIITSLPQGSGLVVLKKSGNWYQVRAIRRGTVGWVSAKRVAKTASATINTKKDPLNVRTKPGTGHTVVGTIKKGRKVTVSSVSGSWFYVTYGSLKGWCSRYASGREVLKFIG